MTSPEKRNGQALVNFMTRVSFPSEKAACWEWAGNLGDGRYGYLHVDGKSVRAHRWIYALLNGPIPDDQVVRHKCDNPKCVNPMHLEIGTHSQNCVDKYQRGRGADRKGAKHPLARITEADVIEIRRLAECGYTHKQISARFDISSQHVGKIVRRENWGHI